MCPSFFALVCSTGMAYVLAGVLFAIFLVAMMSIGVLANIYQATRHKWAQWAKHPWRHHLYFAFLAFLYFVTVLIVIWSPSVAAQDVRTYIPPKAIKLLPMVVVEQEKYFPDLPERGYIAALIEHESCISLKHSRCWEPTSKFETARELGLGLGQLTKAYNADGSVRFDSLAEMKSRYKTDLSELNWDTLVKRADLQVRTITLMSRDNYKQLYTVAVPIERLKMTDAAYNGGLGGLKKERMACGLKKDCDPQYWKGNVEKTCMKSTVVLYGKRSACDINRDHVRLVFDEILPKYKQRLGSQ